jgi:hypothetical protein
MSDINFPSNIKPLTNRNYSFARGSNVVAAKVGGLPRMGLDLTIEAVEFSLNFIMTDYQYQVFLMFYDSKINHGANSFNMNLDSGNGIEVHQCFIKPGTYRSVRPSHGTWSVSFTVIAEDTSSQLGDLCTNLFDLNECYGNDLPCIITGLSEVVEAYPNEL